MAESQMSTAVSDFVLAVTAFGGFASLVNKNLLGSLGFLTIGIAASCGTYRFSCARPSANLVYWHKTLAWFASTLGMSMLASGLHRHIDNPIMSALHMGCALAVVVMAKVFHVFSDQNEVLIASAVSSAAVASIAVLSFLTSNPFGMLGSLVCIAAGVISPNQGTISGVKKVDWFHYFLAFANIVLIRAFKFRPDEVFYVSDD